MDWDTYRELRDARKNLTWEELKSHLRDLRSQGAEDYGKRLQNFEQLSDSEMLIAIAYSTLKVEEAKRIADMLHEQNPVYTLETPEKLKRAISPEGLFDLLETGSVRSKENRWHRVDLRRMNLWAHDHVHDRRILTQAHDTERQSIQAAHMNFGLPVEVIRDMPEEHPVTRWRQKWREERKQLFSASEWTAAVIVTHPVSGCLVWPKHNKGNMMYGMDEYGFTDGTINLNDIEEIRIYRMEDHVLTACPDDILDKIIPLKSPSDIEFTKKPSFSIR